MKLTPQILMLTLLAQGGAVAASWTHQWKPAPNEKQVQVTVAPLKYDKKWAYAIELDDGDVSTSQMAPEFFSQFQFTDAPPGLPGGKTMPVVGSLALFLYRVGINSAYVDLEQTREIVDKGWAVANHSYAHKGRTYGDPPEILTPEEIKTDHFWSQTLWEHEMGQAPSHFVYPNGYIGYAEFLNEFGLVSGSRAAGTGGVNLENMGEDFSSIPRCYLDEGAWANGHGKGDPMASFPKDGPVEGDLIIDFTHAISSDPESPNQKRWKERLTSIVTDYGAGGRDEFWSAPTQEVIAYWRAAKAAAVQATPGSLTVTIPDELPGTPLTIRMEGVPEATEIPVPEGGSLYRKGTTVWLTTPMIGKPGAPSQNPVVKRIYKGEPQPSIVLDSPQRIAAVRVRQHGNPTPEGVLTVNITTPAGTVQEFGTQPQRTTFMSGFHLFASTPTKEAPLAASVEPHFDPSIKEVEIWALDETGSGKRE